MKVLKALLSLTKWQIVGCLIGTIDFVGGFILGYYFAKMIKKEKEEEE